MTTPKYAWVLFDADGTLFDYDAAESRALRYTFEQAELAFSPTYLDPYRRLNGQIWRDFEQGKISQKVLRVKRFQLLSQAIAIDFDAAWFSKHYLLNLGAGTQLIEGAEYLMNVLAGRIGVALITNGLQDVQRARLARSEIGHHFNPVIISEEVGVAKPDVRIFEKAFELMGWPKKDSVLIVGDSLSSDICGGNNYGIGTCWFNPAAKPNDSGQHVGFEIRRLSELPPLLSL